MRSLPLLPHSGHGFVVYRRPSSNPFSKEYVIVIISRVVATEVTEIWFQLSEWLEDDQLVCGRAVVVCIRSLFEDWLE